MRFIFFAIGLLEVIRSAEEWLDLRFEIDDKALTLHPSLPHILPTRLR